MVAEAALDPRHQLTALVRAQQRAEALERTLGQHAPQAKRLAEEKRQAQQIREKADVARQVFRDRLGRTYRDPAAAEAAWRKSCGDKGLTRTMREVARHPEVLGELPGWRVWVFASVERREAERHAVGLVRLGAEARVLGGKAGAARAKLHRLDRQERDDAGLREYTSARNELGPRRSSEITGAVHRAERDLVTQWVTELAVVRADKAPGQVVFEWPRGLGTLERLNREALFDKHQAHVREQLVQDFQRRDPQGFRQWDQVRQGAQQQIKGPSHGGGRRH